jgi:catechol 2,3-dioxygenase-like lactoylglutathione lyase family enzyme
MVHSPERREENGIVNGAFTLDHVELFVRNREEAAAWYARVFGCRPVAGAEEWARLPELGIEKGNTAPVFDHGAWSVYFADPSGHRLEVTTYEADLVLRARGD